MDKVLGVIFAAVVLGASFVLIPMIRTTTTPLFDVAAFESGSFNELFFSFWPVFLIVIFLFGAYMLIKSGGR
ncbi:hypothetical protein LCGC14_0877750 [marine sediment metagenome]|uniref:Uncharacterized protein n=1 Tax=marine sediment metagenome TaxID=412755 RepID=A0A0F9P2S6_9ZZZZ